MITPDCNTIETMARQYSLIPVCKEIYADITTPILLLRKLSRHSKRFYLLESIEGDEKWGRYSFLGYNPIMKVSSKNNVINIEEGNETKSFESSTPLQVLRDILKEYKSPKIPGIPPFTGGFVGYFSYACIEMAEPTLNIARGDFDDYQMMLFDKVIAYDHLRQKIFIVVNMRTDKVMENYGKAVKEIEEIHHMIQKEINEDRKDDSRMKGEFSCSVSKDEYIKMVDKTKEYIQEGDIFQAVISRRFECEYEGSLLNPYRVLRTTNPSPYMVYLNIDDEEIMSTSPETLVRLQDGRLFTFPVAGSRPRGKTEEEDLQLEKELLVDEKELAEHNMLVDLGRNDLGRISKYGSVEVTKYKMIHKYSQIMHMCSQVESNITKEMDAFDAISSVLPAGTLSGAPKIRACEIIDEVETVPRGIYGGALGYIDFNGNMDTCIAIRMAVKKNGKVFVQAGGGIVADSVPENEYEESANKAKAVMIAIKRGSEVEQI